MFFLGGVWTLRGLPSRNGKAKLPHFGLWWVDGLRCEPWCSLKRMGRLSFTHPAPAPPMLPRPPPFSAGGPQSPSSHQVVAAALLKGKDYAARRDVRSGFVRQILWPVTQPGICLGSQAGFQLEELKRSLRWGHQWGWQQAGAACSFFFLFFFFF